MSANRKKPVHPSAMPLLAAIRSKRLTRSSIAASLELDVQNVTNWLARGIPAKQLPEVARLCGMSTDEYRYKAGLGTKPRSGERVPVVLHDFELLPPFLQNYIARKIAKILERYKAVPTSARKRLLPPADPDQHQQWENEVEGLILRLGQYRGSPAKV